MNIHVDHCWPRRALRIVAPCALLLSACVMAPPDERAESSTPELAGSNWIVTRIDGSAPLDGTALTADFSVDGRINGDGGCNHFSGPYIQTGPTVRFGELLSTRRDCVDASHQRQESRLLAILHGPTTARFERDRLSVHADNGSLVLVRNGVTADVTPRRAVFDCEGEALTVVFDADSAQLSWKDGHDVLLRQPVASGIWYRSDHAALRGEQDLRWTADGQMPRTCHELD